MTESLKPFFSRVGNKEQFIEVIESLIPEHITYVEPFVGGGAIFWKRDKSKIVVLNDIERDLMDGYKILKKGVSHFIIPKELEEQRKIYEQKATTPEEKIRKYLLRFNNTFSNSGTGKIYNNHIHKEKIKNIPNYHNKLQGVILLNQDYKKVIKKYDSPTTFFFIDPPYEESKGIYSNEYINYEEMNKLLITIKGLFILTINDSPYTLLRSHFIRQKNTKNHI